MSDDCTFELLDLGLFTGYWLLFLMETLFLCNIAELQQGNYPFYL